MAESLAARLRPGTLVLHLNGAFHSDHRLGIVPRLLRRAPGARVLVVSLVREPSDTAPGDFTIITTR
jgi:uncharacterized iron-regulated protein